MTATSPSAARPSAQYLGEPRRSHANEFIWVWVALALLFAVSSVVASSTVHLSSLRLLAPYASVLVIAAVGQSLVIRQRGIDLSVPGAMSFAGVAVAKITADHGGHLILAVLVTCALMAAVGTVNGLLVTQLGVTPLVTTLAVNALLIGAVQSYSSNVPLGAPQRLSDLALGRVLGVPNPALIAGLVVAAVGVTVSKTVIGRRFVAVGENVATARVAGVRTTRHQVATYAMASVCYALAGILLAGYVQTAVPTAGNSYLLPVIAAVVVGGTPFTGGRGSVVATAVAAVFLTQLLQVVLALGAPSSTQFLVQSIAIAAATGLRYMPWSGVLRSRTGRRNSGTGATSTASSLAVPP